MQDIRLRGLSEDTISEYHTKARAFMEHFGKSADEMGEKEFREFLQYLANERKLSPASINTYNSGLRFLYEITLEQSLNYKRLPRVKEPILLPKEFFGESASSNGSWNCLRYNNGSSYSSYQSALNDNCPIMLILHTTNGIFSKGDGHAVYAFGYANSTNGDDYIFVMDGWNTYSRFVKFNYYPYFFGFKIYVK